MKSILLTLFTVLSLSATYSQGAEKNPIVIQLEELEKKIATYKSQLNSTNLEDADFLYEMNYDLQTNLNEISDIAYEIASAGTEEEIVEIEEDIDDAVEEIEEEIGDWMNEDDEDEKSYKGDFDLGDNVKSNVMKSLNGVSFVMGWGINSLSPAEGGVLKTESWGSSNWEFGIVRKKQLGNSKTRLVYGLTFATHYFKLNGLDITPAKDSPGYVVTDNTVYDKVRFGAQYVQVPILLGIKLGRKAELSLGGHAGLKVNGYTKKWFDSEIIDDGEENIDADFGLNTWAYGVDASFGWKNWRVYGKYDLNPLFENGTEYNIWTVGLRYGY